MIDDAGDLAAHLGLLSGGLGEVGDVEGPTSGVGHLVDLERRTARVIVIRRLDEVERDAIAVLVGDVCWIAVLVEEVGHPVGACEGPPVCLIGGRILPQVQMHSRWLYVIGVAAAVQVALELVVAAVAVRESNPAVGRVGVRIIGMDIDGQSEAGQR